MLPGKDTRLMLRMLYSIADQFAANGFFTVIPDLFSGDPVPLNRPGDFDLWAWHRGPPSKDVGTVE